VQYRETPSATAVIGHLRRPVATAYAATVTVSSASGISQQQTLYQTSLQQALSLIQQLGSTDVLVIIQAQSELDALAQLQLSPELPGELQAAAQLERLVRQLTQERGL